MRGPSCTGVTQLKDWHAFPQWQPENLQERFPDLEPDGVDLMQQMFIYDPAKRITVIHQLPPHLQPCEIRCLLKYCLVSDAALTKAIATDTIIVDLSASTLT